MVGGAKRGVGGVRVAEERVTEQKERSKEHNIFSGEIFRREMSRYWVVVKAMELVVWRPFTRALKWYMVSLVACSQTSPSICWCVAGTKR